jgi:hypothetical protein
MVSRADRSAFAEWWWTVDKYLFAGLMALMLGGVVLSLAGSPAVAERLGYDSFHFVKRHLFFFLPAVAVMIATSFLNPRQARRTALIVLVVSLVLMLATLFVGVEVKGARRWLNILGFSIQPSEFMKPAFVVIIAWLFAENAKRSDIPGNVFALILLAIAAALLVAEPDFGQTMLITIAWGALFFMAGMPWLWIAALGVVARRPLRRAVGDQHGGQPPPDAAEGHDAALHLLWRLVDDRRRLRHGAAPRLQPQASRAAAGPAPHRGRRAGPRRPRVSAAWQAQSSSPPAAPAAISSRPRRSPSR